MGWVDSYERRETARYRRLLEARELLKEMERYDRGLEHYEHCLEEAKRFLDMMEHSFRTTDPVNDLQSYLDMIRIHHRNAIEHYLLMKTNITDDEGVIERFFVTLRAKRRARGIYSHPPPYWDE